MGRLLGGLIPISAAGPSCRRPAYGPDGAADHLEHDPAMLLGGCAAGSYSARRSDGAAHPSRVAPQLCGGCQERHCEHGSCAWVSTNAIACRVWA